MFSFHHEVDNLKGVLANIQNQNKNVLVVFKFSHYLDNEISFKKLKDEFGFDFFFVKKYFEDDLLSLFITLKSGPNCFLVSNDKFTDHISAHAGKDLSQFRNWISSRVIKFQYPFNNIDRKKIQLIIPPNYNMITEKFGENKWFIPYINEISHSFLIAEKK